MNNNLKNILFQLVSLDKEGDKVIADSIVLLDSMNLKPEEIADKIYNLHEMNRIKMFLMALANDNDKLANKIDEANEIIQQMKSKNHNHFVLEIDKFEMTSILLILGILNVMNYKLDDLAEYISIMDEEYRIKMANYALLLEDDCLANKIIDANKIIRQTRQHRISDFKQAVLNSTHKEFLEELFYTDKYFLKLDMGLVGSKPLLTEDKMYFDIIMDSIKEDARKLYNETIDFVRKKER